MKRLLITCVGAYPIMMDPMTDEVLDSLATGVRVQIQKDLSHADVARKKIYRENGDKDGRIGLPTEMLFATLVAAGRKVSYRGKTNISTAETSMLPGLLTINEDFLPFPIPDGATEPKWTVDKRRGRLENGTAVCLRRPKFADWGFEVTIDFDDKEISEGKVRELFNIAGRFCGLGSFRPSCKGPFGRFAVQKLADITPTEWANEPAEEIEEGDDTDQTGGEERRTGNSHGRTGTRNGALAGA